jgi:putative photosynthetic complex assembly protein
MGGAGAVARPPRPSASVPQVLGTAALLLAVLAATVLNRPGPGDLGAGRGEGRAPLSADLRFEDRPDGGVAVRRAEDGSVAAVLAPGTEGFVRAALRGLARDRKRGDLGHETPFRLSAWPGGGLTIEDRATGRTLDLRAFGHTQAEAFGRLLAAAAKEDRR